ncbi:hypothetical protein HAX54_003719 [Datura stramonium]|uniref:Uncharacterized protein n=1 Tax=Datura stramonium TaxID=4076 RepID=A0ABS8T6T1_DATST|nr:hypothetical protein [Datura stramonium]
MCGDYSECMLGRRRTVVSHRIFLMVRGGGKVREEKRRRGWCRLEEIFSDGPFLGRLVSAGFWSKWWMNFLRWRREEDGDAVAEGVRHWCCFAGGAERKRKNGGSPEKEERDGGRRGGDCLLKKRENGENV